MAQKTEIYTFEGRTFEVTTVLEAGFQGEMAHSFIYEVVRPTWKFFRTRIIDDKTFWVSDYETIQEGAKAMLARVLSREKELAEVRQKWADFEK